MRSTIASEVQRQRCCDKHLRHLPRIFLVSFIFLASLSANSSSLGAEGKSPATSGIKILLGADQRVCTSLLAVYNRRQTIFDRFVASYNRLSAAEKTKRFGDTLDRKEVDSFWEDDFPEDFNSAGFALPSPIKGRYDGSYFYYNEMPRSALYDLRTDAAAPSRFVYLKDWPTGDLENTYVYVFKPGEQFRVVDFPTDPGSVEGLQSSEPEKIIAPDAVDFVVAFDGGSASGQTPDAYGRRLTVGAYLSPSDGIVFQTDHAPPRLTMPSLNATGVVQRILRFEGQFYITARDMGSATALVYRPTETGTLQTVCFYIWPGYAEFFKKSKVGKLRDTILISPAFYLDTKRTK